MPRPDPRAHARTLDRLTVGRMALVVGVTGAAADELLHEGIAPGVTVTIESRTPLGGPLIVRVGRSRVAVARPAAGDVRILAADPGLP